MKWYSPLSKDASEKLASELHFTSIHNHTEISNFRLRDCIIRIDDLINKAIENDYNGVICTDHEALTGHVKLIQRYKTLQEEYKIFLQMKDDSIKLQEECENNKEFKKDLPLLMKYKGNFKLGLGNEIYLIDSIEDVTTNYVPKTTKYYHFILIAKDQKGYEQLKRISSESAWKNWFRQGGVERCPTIKRELEDVIGEEKGHLIATTACLGSELDTLIIEYLHTNSIDSKRKINQFIQWGINVFGRENFFLEIQPCIVHNDASGKMIESDQIIVNQFMFTLGKAYNLNVVCSTDSHYLSKEDAGVHEAYLRADDSEKASNREVASFYETTYMFEKAELVQTLSYYLTIEEITQCINNTKKIHEMIQPIELEHPVIVPRDKNIPKFKIRHLFEKYYKKYEYIKKYAESEDEQDQYLLYLVENGFEKKCGWENDNFHFVTYDYEGKVIEEYDKTIDVETKLSRINEEFSSFWQISEKINQKLSSYYNLVRGLVQEIMWKVSYVGVGRGSVGGSYICYLIEITQINPLKFDLPFWRHSSPLRPELPDIDLDSESCKRQLIFNMMKEYYGEENVINTLTLKTEGTKATALVCARGIGLTPEEGQFLASLIPFERGSNWSLKDCFEGNEELGRKPVKELLSKVNEYPGLKEMMLKTEGLICGRSIHASAMYCFDKGYLSQNSRMRAPNGTWITAFNMIDSDYQGGLKVDCLTVQQLDKLHKTIDLLIEDGVIKDKGSIKNNYDAYLHPDMLEYNDYKMWNALDNNLVLDVFQFDTPVGKQAITTTQPRSLLQLSTANSLMRLMAQDGMNEAPMETYKRYKNDISLWYKEMSEAGLNQEEQEILKKQIGDVYGVAETQEAIMQLSMDPAISGFDVVYANKLRKAVAKKKAKLIKEICDKFYEMGRERGTSNAMLNYVWNVQIARQLGYSFSKNHCMPYSTIALQSLNLVTKYNPVYWNCACLVVNGGCMDDSDENTDYAKIAMAIDKMRGAGISIILPDINKARYGFYPDAKNMEIVYGLKPIQGIGTDVAKAITSNQPYNSLEDFCSKMEECKKDKNISTLGEIAIISLIKAGAFDVIENKPREEIMGDFIKKISKPIQKLTMAHIEDLQRLGLLTKEQELHELCYYKYKRFIYQEKFLDKKTGKSPATFYYKLTNKKAEEYFYNTFESKMIEGKDYEYSSDGYVSVKRGALDKVIDKLSEDFVKNTLTKREFLDKINEEKFQEVWEERAQGNISKWEMESINYYYHEHELKNVDRKKYNISDFSHLPIEAEIEYQRNFRGKEVPRFKLSRICGTVIEKNSNSNTVTLLTSDGVVTVRFYKGQYTFYAKEVAEKDPITNKKTVLEKSWFKRGNKLLITGIRQDEQFIPKQYKDSIYKHSVQLIKNIDDKGNLTLISDRVNSDKEEENAIGI